MLLKLWLGLTESIDTIYGMERLDRKYLLQEKAKLDAAQEISFRYTLKLRKLTLTHSTCKNSTLDFTYENMGMEKKISFLRYWTFSSFTFWFLRVTVNSICLFWMPQIKKHFNWIKTVRLHYMAVVCVVVAWIAIKDVQTLAAATTTISLIYQSIETVQRIITFTKFRTGYKKWLVTYRLYGTVYCCVQFA